MALSLKPSAAARLRVCFVVAATQVCALAFCASLSAGEDAGNRQLAQSRSAETRPADEWRAFDPVVRAVNRGVALMERYEYAAAVEAFEEAAGLAPSSVEVQVNLALAVFNRAEKGDLPQAEEMLDAVLRDDPGNARALYLRGITHQYSGRDAEALALFERLRALRPDDAYTWYLLARCKSHLGQPCQAELERAIELNPNLASAYYDRMRLAAQAGETEEAREYQRQFMELRQHALHEMFVMPQYGQMGPLARVRPLAGAPGRPVTSGELEAGDARTVFEASAPLRFAALSDAERAACGPGVAELIGVQMAFADVNGDQRLDLITTAAVRAGERGLLLLLQEADGCFADVTEAAGLLGVRHPTSLALGDYDNDNHVDVFVACAGPNRLFRARGDGTFEDVTQATGTGGPAAISHSAVFLDADHDADLDIFVCNGAASDGSGTAPNQLLNNNADGTFTDIAERAGVIRAKRSSVMLAPADLDLDRDTDLIVFHADGPTSVFFNDRGGNYTERSVFDDPLDARGGVAQDFNGDGRADLMVPPTSVDHGRLLLSGASGTLRRSPQFEQALQAILTWGGPGTSRVADLDLDGDLDLALLGCGGHVLLNDGAGRFVGRANVWPAAGAAPLSTSLLDLTNDGVPDLLRVSADGGGRVELVATKLTPPANWLAIVPTGDRGDDGRTRSPASGFGTRMQVQAGLHSQVLTYTGLSGELSQSLTPAVFGLNGVSAADYLMLTWPDGVTQSENGLASGAVHRVHEMERRVSSCPVLFAWDGWRFGFVGDFSGVGGVGYYIGPGEYAAPQVSDHVLLRPGQLAERDGFYELRICEPMEEVAYVDRLELVAVDHPRQLQVYPDERLAVTGPPPTQRLLCPDEPVYAVRAMGPDGGDCADRLRAVDRVYAYQPELDPRFLGFCRPHVLELDFGERLADVATRERVYFFLAGSIEYPYSQTTYAAGQAGVLWRPLRLELRRADGTWETLVPDAGAPGGMGRTIAIDVSGRLPAGECVLRLTTNLEIYYDQVFVAADRGTEDLIRRRVPLVGADLRYCGFPAEFSPDGQHPTIYTYDSIAATSSFKRPRGAYTRYGPVERLLAEFDDRYAILGSGDEIAVRFYARALPELPAGHARSFVLISHAYCKDMDLYTGACDTVGPLPHREMRCYPYPVEDEPSLGDASLNTRVVE